MKKYLTNTADDEEPCCQKCDHINDSDKWCMENCGGAHSWNGYRRTVLAKENKHDGE